MWNVDRPGGRPRSEWEIVETAHPAIITLDEAEAIMQVNERENQPPHGLGLLAQTRTWQRARERLLRGARH